LHSIRLKSPFCNRNRQIPSNISIGIVASVEAGYTYPSPLPDCMLDVNDLMEFEEDEFRRFQMVLFPVLLTGAVGGIRERTFC